MADDGPQTNDSKAAAGPERAQGLDGDPPLTLRERKSRLRGRNLLLGGALLLLVLLLYAVSFVKTPPGPGGPAESGQGDSAPAAQPLSGLRNE